MRARSIQRRLGHGYGSNPALPWCFISYSRRDEGFAQLLVARLRNEGVNVWFAPKDLESGALAEQVQSAIRQANAMVLVLSAASTASGWVAAELRMAGRAVREQGHPWLVPIRLIAFEDLRAWTCRDECGHDLAGAVREQFIRDFSGWEERERFEAAFTPLVMDLLASRSVDRKRGRGGHAS